MEYSSCALPCDLKRVRWLPFCRCQMGSTTLSWTTTAALCCHPCWEVRDTSSQSSSLRGRAPLTTSTHIAINRSLLELALLTWTPPPRSSKAWSNSSAMNGWRAWTIGRQWTQLAQHAADLERRYLPDPTLLRWKEGAECLWVLPGIFSKREEWDWETSRNGANTNSGCPNGGPSTRMPCWLIGRSALPLQTMESGSASGAALIDDSHRTGKTPPQLCLPQVHPNPSVLPQLVLERGVDGGNSVRSTHNVDIVQIGKQFLVGAQFSRNCGKSAVPTQPEQGGHWRITLLTLCLRRLPKCTGKGPHRIAWRKALPLPRWRPSMPSWTWSRTRQCHRLTWLWHVRRGQWAAGTHETHTHTHTRTLHAWTAHIGSGLLKCLPPLLGHRPADQSPHDVSCNDASLFLRLLQGRHPLNARHTNDFVSHGSSRQLFCCTEEDGGIVCGLQEGSNLFNRHRWRTPTAPRSAVLRLCKNVSWSNLKRCASLKHHHFFGEILPDSRGTSHWIWEGSPGCLLPGANGAPSNAKCPEEISPICTKATANLQSVYTCSSPPASCT